jgi:glycosyltransferase involved in cell wall biosynthesis
LNIIVFKGKSFNNTLEYFANGIASGFENEGHNVYFIDMNKTTNAMNIYSGIKALNADFSFSFNIIYPNIFKTSEIYDTLGLPHFAFFTDHPMHHYFKFRNPDSENLYISCIDKSHIDYINYLSGKKNIFFIPHAVNRKNSKETKKNRDFIFIGNMANPDNYLNDLKNQFEKDVWILINEIIEYLMDSPEKSLHYGIKKIFSDKNIPQLYEDRKYVQIIMKILEHYIRNKTRIDSLLALKDFNIHIYGLVDPSLSQLTKNYRKRIFKNIDYYKIPELIQESRYSINISRTLCNGSHERVFESLINRVPVLSTHSDFLENIFKDNKSVCFYRTDKTEKLAAKAEYLMENYDSVMENIDNACSIVLKKHTWENRATDVINLMKNIIGHK